MNDLNTRIDAFLDRMNIALKRFNEAHGFTHAKGEHFVRDGGKKYLKISRLTESDGEVTRCSAWGFIALVDVLEKNVKAGDILMAATYKAPALKVKVPARGSVYDDTCVLWVGPYGPTYKVGPRMGWGKVEVSDLTLEGV